jgi:nucleoid DNA-binding protein
MGKKEGKPVSTVIQKNAQTGAAPSSKAQTPGKPLKAIAEKQSKAQILQTLAEDTGLSKKEVGAVLSSLSTLVRRHLTKKGSGEFAIPEVGVKLKRVLRPATQARKGRNPLTGEEILIKAKPATAKIRALPLKALKEVVQSN